MNDQSTRLPIDPDDDDDDSGDGEPLPRSALQRRLMERARLAAERDNAKPPSRALQHALALVAALVVVLTVTLGFDVFLSSMQRVMRMLDENEQRLQQEELRQQEEKRRLLEAIPLEQRPMPAYVVPPAESPDDAAVGEEPPPSPPVDAAAEKSVE